uniref:RICTOR_V domain-containing protein n=1 Tax=Macrostomum lignano TaxID=282301 RepID=A0A1I8ICA2_9PLAT
SAQCDNKYGECVSEIRLVSLHQVAFSRDSNNLSVKAKQHLSRATEESTTNTAFDDAMQRSQLRLNRVGSMRIDQFRAVNSLLCRSNSLNGPSDGATPSGQQPHRLNTDFEFRGKLSLSASAQLVATPPAGGESPQQEDPPLGTDYEFRGRPSTQSDSAAQEIQQAEQPGTDYEFQGKTLSSSSQPNVQLDFNQQSTQTEKSQPDSSTSMPKFEVDFKQGGATESSAITTSAPKFEVDFRQKLSSEGKPTNTTDDTQDGNESETKELEGESHTFPVPPPRILTQPMAAVKKSPSLVFGHLSIMVASVSDEAMLLPLKSPALADLLDNAPKYRAIALRCACELIFTRRIIVKRVVKWCRYSLLLLRGPSDSAIKKFRQCLESTNRAFHEAVPFDIERNRPRLLASEMLPDNLGLAVCADRLGPASATWEQQMHLNMPQKKLGKPLFGKQLSQLLPNNRAISPVLAHVYPKWGFQTSRPIPHSQLFEAAVDEALELEKRQAAELKK